MDGGGGGLRMTGKFKQQRKEDIWEIVYWLIDWLINKLINKHHHTPARPSKAKQRRHHPKQPHGCWLRVEEGKEMMNEWMDGKMKMEKVHIFAVLNKLI